MNEFRQRFNSGHFQFGHISPPGSAFTPPLIQSGTTHAAAAELVRVRLVEWGGSLPAHHSWAQKWTAEESPAPSQLAVN